MNNTLLTTRLDSWPTPLPVFVQEAISQHKDDSRRVSCAIQTDGWLKIIAGSKLFLWNIKSDEPSVSCHIIPLPPSGLSHSAQLALVIPGGRRRRADPGRVQPATTVSPICCYASPEGSLRFWPNAAHENSFSETNLELNGQECSVIDFLPGIGILVATTTCSLVMLLFDPTAAIWAWRVVPLRPSQGIVAGVSRRLMTYLFSAEPGVELKLLKLHVSSSFVASPAAVGEESTTNRRVTRSSPRKLAGLAGAAQPSAIVHVLTDRTLQCWTVQGPDCAEHVWNLDLQKCLTEAMLSEIWQLKTAQVQADYRHSMRIELMDIVIHGDKMMVLAAGMNECISMDAHFVLADIKIDKVPVMPNQLTLLNFQQKFQGKSLPKLSITYAEENGQYLLHDKWKVWKTTASECSGQPAVRLELIHQFVPQNGFIVESGAVRGHFVAFVQPMGLFYAHDETDIEKLMDESLVDASMDMSLINESTLNKSLNDLRDSKDSRSVLTAAFLSFLNTDLKTCMDLVTQLTTRKRGLDLNEVVGSVSDAICDHPSEGDPRSVGALHVFLSIPLNPRSQLVEKRRYHDMFVSFLKKTELWSQLGVSTNEDGSGLPTALLLLEQTEKLVAALALLTSSKLNVDLINEAIGSHELYSQYSNSTDEYYKLVTKSDSIVTAVVNCMDRLVDHVTTLDSRVNLISGIIDIVTTFMCAASDFRQAKALAAFAPSPDSLVRCVQNGLELWTDRPTISESLLKLQQTTLSTLAEITDRRLKSAMIDQLARLIGCCLGGFQFVSMLIGRYHSDVDLIQSLLSKSRADYEAKREKLIMPLVYMGFEDVACRLAEQYEDFGVLITVCDKQGADGKLRQYAEKFANKGFEDFQYRWYLKQGKPARLINLSTPKNTSRVGELLTNQPELAWIHRIRSQDYLNASHTLKNLANQEQLSVKRKKNHLSLAKLALLASDASASQVKYQMQDINDGLDLIFYQENLPQKLSKSKSSSKSTLTQPSAPLPIERLIELYTQDPQANPLSYKNALDLLFRSGLDRESEQFVSIKLKIWSQAIHRSDWSGLDKPKSAVRLEDYQDTPFFGTISLVVNGGLNPMQYLPSVDELLNQSQLGRLVANKSFQILLKMGFEQLRIRANTPVIMEGF